jgi:rhodanese-related sulfurtransferase
VKVNNFQPADAAQIVDVRTDREWNAGHIEKALHIPLNELTDKLSELDKAEAIVAVCRTGVRSEKAVEILRSRGFDAENLEGGLRAAAAAGHALVDSDGKPGSVIAQTPETDNLNPALAGARDNLIEIAFALQDRFGDERTEEQELEFMRAWLAEKGKTPEEIERALSQGA